MEKVILAEIEKLVKERNELRLQLGEARELIRRRRKAMNGTRADENYYGLEYPVCPYCDADFPEAELMEMDNEESRIVKCRECGKEFKVTVFHTVTWDCEKTGEEKCDTSNV